MTRKSRVAVLVVFVAAIFVVVTYLALRPKWVTATPAEIDKVIDPILLVKQAPDPAASTRYDRLYALIKSLPKTPTPGSSGLPPGLPGAPTKFSAPTAKEISLAAQSYRREVKDDLPRIEALLEEGPIRQPVRKPFDISTNGSVAKAFAKGLALLIDDSSAPIGDRLAAVRLGMLYSRRNFENSESLIDVLVGIAIEAIVDAPTRKLLGSTRLTAAQAKSLLASMPDIENETRLDKALVCEFQSFTYQFLPDPLKFLKDAKKGLSWLNSGDDSEEEDEPYGQYNAIEAAKEFSDLTVEEIRNSETPVSKISNPVADRVQKISASLPEQDFENKQGFGLWWAKRVYGFKMDRIPNSFAYFSAPFTGIRNVLLARDEIRAWNRLLRLQTACNIYAGKKGHFPAALSDVVSAEILPTIPKDPLGDCPMHYDPSRKIIWSVGRNLVDDHGSELRSGARTEDDVVHLLAAKP